MELPKFYHGAKSFYLFMMFFGASCGFFGLLFLSSIGLGNLLPVQSTIILAVVLSLLIGFILQSRLLKQQRSYFKSFLIGCSIFLLLLPFFDIGAVFMMNNQFHGTHSLHSTLTDYFTLYLIVLLYSLIFVGSWLSVVGGLMFLAFSRFYMTPTHIGK